MTIRETFTGKLYCAVLRDTRAFAAHAARSSPPFSKLYWAADSLPRTGWT